MLDESLMRVDAIQGFILIVESEVYQGFAEVIGCRTLNVPRDVPTERASNRTKGTKIEATGMWRPIASNYRRSEFKFNCPYQLD
jgi:hypothetical protein